MADKKDLSEAQQYSRRRLVTAFTSGIPDGVELAPRNNRTPVLVGVGLTIIAIVASMFYGTISPALPSGWQNNKLIVAKDSAARYVSADGTLHPVINAVSARLLIPSSDFEVITVADDQLDNIPIGSTIGILGAPDSLPERGSLITGSISSCTSDAGTATTVSDNGAAQASREAVHVTADGTDYLVTGSRRYRLPSEPSLRDAYVRAFGMSQTTSMNASAQWVNLFERGDNLEPITVPGEGKPISVHGINVTVGGVVTQQGDSRHHMYVVMPDGSLSTLNDFTYNLYVIGKSEQLAQPQKLNAADFQYFSSSTEPAIPDTWPATTLSSKRDLASACATYPLHRSKKAAASQVRLTTTAGHAKDINGKRTDTVSITGGTGALVRAAIGNSNQGTVFAIDSTGTAYPIPHASEEILKRLGYTQTDVRNIPRAWIDVFPQGVQLTAKAAGSTPHAPSSSDGMAVDAAMADGQGQCQAGVENYITRQPWTTTLFDYDTLHQQATGKGVTVAVIDSGVDVSNPHLSKAVVPGVSFIDGDASNGMEDVYSHGTAVAGIIAAGSIQGSSIQGLAPDARILPIRVFESIREQDGRQTGAPSMETVSKAIVAAVDHHAQIINISLSDTQDIAPMREAVQYAQSHGSLIVASAGNRLTSASTRDGARYPAAYPDVLGVTALNTDLEVTEDSVHGGQVDVAAPGMMTASTIPGGVDCVFATDVSSTSFATAYVSAEAALIAQQYPDETPAQWKQRILVSANRPDSDRRDDTIGWGIMDPFNALSLPLSDGVRGPRADGTVPARQHAKGAGRALVLHAQHDADAGVKLFAGATTIMVVCVCAVAWLLVLRRRETARDGTAEHGTDRRGQ